MLTAFDGGKTVEECANLVRRTKAAVISRLEQLNRVIYIVQFDNQAQRYTAGYYKIEAKPWCDMRDVRP